jgi:SAM-dependent methyltransferase
VLGLASGGGQQMPVLAGRGAECTLLDYSRRQLESDLEVARREGLEINAVHADMTKPLPFEDGSFDLIVNPVSVCYIRDVLPLWRECFRVLRRGGTIMAGLDNGINYIFDDSETRLAYSLPFDPLVYPGHMACLSRGDFGVQFSHTLDDQIRGQIKAGFVLRDLFEDYNESGPLSEHRVPAFWATLAEKP